MLEKNIYIILKVAWILCVCNDYRVETCERSSMGHKLIDICIETEKKNIFQDLTESKQCLNAYSIVRQ